MWHSAAEAPRPSAMRRQASPLAMRDPRGLVYNVAARQSPHRRGPRDGDGLARSTVRGLLQRVLVLLSVAPRSMGPGRAPLLSTIWSARWQSGQAFSWIIGSAAEPARTP